MSEAATRARLEELEEEVRLLQEQLAAHSSGSVDLKLIGVNQELKAKVERLEKDNEELGNKNVELAFEIEELEEQIQGLQSELTAARDAEARRDVLEGEVTGLRKQLEEARATLDERQQTFQARLLEASEQLAELQSRLTSAESNLRSRESQIEQERERIAQLEERLGASQARVRELETAGGELLDDAKKTLAELEKETGRADELEKQLHGVQSKLTESEQHLAGLRESSQRESEQLRKTQDELETLKAERGRLESSGKQLEEEVARLKGEVAGGRDREQRLSAELAEGQARIQQLEQNITQLKTMMIEAPAAAVEPAAATAGPITGTPQEILTAVLTDVLGSTGKVLVNRVYSRSKVDPASTDRADLESILKSLEETAARLVSNPDQAARLKEVLERFNASLESGTFAWIPETGEAPPAPPPRPVAKEPAPSPAVEEAVTRAAKRVEPEPVAEEPEPVAKPPEPEPEPEPEPAAEEPEPAPAAEEPEPVPAPPAREPEDKVENLLDRLEEEDKAEEEEDEEPVFLSATDLLAKLELEDKQAAEAVLEQAAQEATAEAADADAPAEEVAVVALPGSHEAGAVWTEDPALLEKIEKGMQMLRHLNMDESFEYFTELYKQHPDVAQVEAGLFYNYASFSCWMEAYEHGRRLIPVMHGRDEGQFVNTMSQVLNERISQSRSMAEKKLCLLQLAELHLSDPEQALDFLRRAKRIPNPIRGEGRIDFYLTCLLAGTPEDRSTYLRNYLSSVADSPLVFRHLDDIYRESRHRQQAPVARTVVALGREGEARARSVEAEAGDLLAPAPPSADLLEQVWNKGEGSLLKLFLDELLPRAKIAPRFPAPHFQAILDDAEAASDSWRPKKLVADDNQKIFALPRLEFKRYKGNEKFMVCANPEPEPIVVVHKAAEELPDGQLRFFLLSTLYQIKRRHLHLYRAAEMLDDEARLRLLAACRDHVIQSGVDISDSLDRKIESLKPDQKDLPETLRNLLDQLYDHTLSDEFDQLKEFMFTPRPFRDQLEGAADRFATRLVGLTEASYAVAREELGAGSLLEQIKKKGFQVLYGERKDEHRPVRLRLQRIWLGPLLRAHQ